MVQTLVDPPVRTSQASRSVPVDRDDARRLRLSAVSAAEVASIVGAAVGGLALAWVLDQRVIAWSGALGFWLLAYGLFLTLYTVVASAQWPVRAVADRVVATVVASAALLVLVIVVDQMVFTVDRGSRAIVHGNFWSRTMSVTGPLDPLSSGGMLHALVGSLEQLGLATVFSVPLGLAAALYLVEVGDWLARPVRIIVEAMTALPEIIAGLFVYAFVILTLGWQRSGFAASLALTVMMIPVVTRTAEVIFRLVPHPLREASYALGSSHFRTVWAVVLPTARSGLATAVILAMARAVGETSPVLLTAGFTKELNTDPFSGPQTSLPLYIYNYVRYPQATMVQRAFGGGLALMAMVLILFVLARVIGGRPPGQLGKRQRRRLARELGAGADQVLDEQRRADDAPAAAPPAFIGPAYPDPPTPG